MRTKSILSLTLLLATPGLPFGASQDSGCDPCDKAARVLRTAGRHEARGDFWVGYSYCLNLIDPDARDECFEEIAEERQEAMQLVADQFRKRLELCELLGGGTFNPVIDPANYVSVIDNAFFPQTPGTTRIYEKTGEEGIERVEETVLATTREILGVDCVIVHVLEFLNGDLTEETEDYYAQDISGNVWYFGELALNFEDGVLSDLDGSWIAGEDGAQAGILMQAAPAVGQVYRQEFLATEAEDAAGVVGLGRTVSVPYGVFTNALETFEFTPLEPDALEAKFYAPGIGLLVAVDVESGEREELISIF